MNKILSKFVRVVDGEMKMVASL